LSIFKNKAVDKSCKIADFCLLGKPLRVAVEDEDELRNDAAVHKVLVGSALSSSSAVVGEAPWSAS
jgi:hypothetical protein